MLDGWLLDRDDQDARGRGVYAADEPREGGEVSGVRVQRQKGGGGVVSSSFSFAFVSWCGARFCLPSIQVCDGGVQAGAGEEADGVWGGDCVVGGRDAEGFWEEGCGC